MPVLAGSGFGSWKLADPSVPLQSSTSKGPSDKLIFADPDRGTKIRLPPLQVWVLVPVPMMFRLKWAPLGPPLPVMVRAVPGDFKTFIKLIGGSTGACPQAPARSRLVA